MYVRLDGKLLFFNEFPEFYWKILFSDSSLLAAECLSIKPSVF